MKQIPVAGISSHVLADSQEDVFNLGLNFSVLFKASLSGLIGCTEKSFKSRNLTDQRDTLHDILASIISYNNGNILEKTILEKFPLILLNIIGCCRGIKF